MKTAEAKRVQQAFIEKMDYDELMNCTRCGFCLPSCPTYFETGNDEVHSPRGRIALMKGVVDGVITPSDELKNSLDICLGCRACEPACPSGVKFGKLLEQSRDALYQTNDKSIMTKVVRNTTFNQLFPNKKRVRQLTNIIRLYQQSGLQTIARKTKLIHMLPKHLVEMEKTLPTIPKQMKETSHEQLITPSQKPKTRVAFFTGCLMDTIFQTTNEATTKLLQLAGCEIVIPHTQGCCGALHGHSGELTKARELAKRNIQAFENADVEYIITNAGGCGAFLHDYDELFSNDEDWLKRANHFSKKIKDISEVLVDLRLTSETLSLPEQIVTYQDSCHLKNVQKTANAPRKLIQAIKGVTFIEMKDAGRCCGSAGVYNIVEPVMSAQILNTKMNHAKATNATTIVTANPGCLLQMKLGVEREGLADKVRVVHIADLLLEAYKP